MVVYIEDALFDESVINCVLLCLTSFSLRQKIKSYKFVLSALVGSVASIVLSTVVLPTIFSIICKLILGLIMCVIVLNKFSLKCLSVFYLVFCSFTFLLGGFCFFIVYLLGGEIYSLATLKYSFPISLGVVVLIIAIYIYFLINIIKLFYKKQKINNFCFDLSLKANDKTILLVGYLDTGNILVDKQTSLPVIVIGLKTFLDLFSNKVSIIDFLNLKLDSKINGRYIEVKTINKVNKMFVFKPQEIKIISKNNLELNALIGVSANLNFENFDVLLNPLCMLGEG